MIDIQSIQPGGGQLSDRQIDAFVHKDDPFNRDVDVVDVFIPNRQFKVFLLPAQRLKDMPVCENNSIPKINAAVKGIRSLLVGHRVDQAAVMNGYYAQDAHSCEQQEDD